MAELPEAPEAAATHDAPDAHEAHEAPETRELVTGTSAADRRIVVGVDGSPSSRAALRRGARIAAALNCSLTAVTSWQYPVAYGGYAVSGWSPEEDARAIAEETAADVFGAQRPPGFTIAIHSGSAAHALIAESDGAEMLIVGSRGHGGFAGLLLGSVSSACAEYAKCPVLIMHDADAARA